MVPEPSLNFRLSSRRDVVPSARIARVVSLGPPIGRDVLDVRWTYAEGSALCLPCGFGLLRVQSPMLKDKVSSSTASAHLGGRCIWTITKTVP